MTQPTELSSKDPVTISVARAAVGDAEAIARLAAATFALACPADTPQRDLDGYIEAELSAARFLDHLASSDKRLSIALVDGNIAGYLMLSVGAAPPGVGGLVPLELQRLYVLARFHGSGVAQRLVDEALAQGLAGQHDVIWLGVSRHNPRAISFYGKAGFRTVGEKQFRVGNDIHEDLVMSRRL